MNESNERLSALTSKVDEIILDIQIDNRYICELLGANISIRFAFAIRSFARAHAENNRDCYDLPR